MLRMDTKNPKPRKGIRRDRVIALRVSPEEQKIIGRLAISQERSQCWIVRDALKKAGILPAEVSTNGTAKK